MFDHIGLKVKNLDVSARFYKAVLAPLGYVPDGSGTGFGPTNEPALWLYKAADSQNGGTHMALRATSRGGHIAVQDAVIAQFGSSIRALRSFSRLRRARNSFEYPSTETPGPSEDDVKDAIRVAREVNDAADKILESGILSPW